MSLKAIGFVFRSGVSIVRAIINSGYRGIITLFSIRLMNVGCFQVMSR